MAAIGTRGHSVHELGLHRALVLGAAGILDGLRATTHWAYLDTLQRFGATPVGERVVEDGKVITAAGVSSGIDMALHLAAKLAGEDAAKAIQLGIEYDPRAPVRRRLAATRRPTTWSRRFAARGPLRPPAPTR